MKITVSVIGTYFFCYTYTSLKDYSSMRTGLNMNNKRHKLPVVYTMFSLNTLTMFIRKSYVPQYRN